MKSLCYFLVLCASFWWLDYASATDWLGDVPVGETINFNFNTLDSSGAPVTIAGTPAIEVYEDGGTTQITAGDTLTEDFDSVTGLHNIELVCTGANGYEAGKYYSVVIAGTTPTADSVSILGRVVGRFRCVEAENVAGTPAADITYVDGSAASSSIATGADIADAVWDESRGETTGVPGATETMVDKINVLYQALIFGYENTTSNGGEKRYKDSGGSVEWEKDLTDNGTTYTESAAGTPD